MKKLRNLTKAGIHYNKSYVKGGPPSWKNCDLIPGYNECIKVMEDITWTDLKKAVGYNENYLFEQPIATHVLYELERMRIMLIFFGHNMDFPLHDHEGMVVFSKCIKGYVESDFYDVADADRFYDKVRAQDYTDIKQK